MNVKIMHSWLFSTVKKKKTTPRLDPMWLLANKKNPRQLAKVLFLAVAVNLNSRSKINNKYNNNNHYYYKNNNNSPSCSNNNNNCSLNLTIRTHQDQEEKLPT